MHGTRAACRRPAAAAIADTLDLVGGDDGDDRPLDALRAYEPAADAWRERARMPAPRHGPGALALGNVVYVVAGGPTPGGSASGANEAFVP